MIYYDIQDSIFGKTLIAITKNGVCAILFGDSSEQELNKMFKRADTQIVYKPNIAGQIIKKINNGENLKNIPIDILVGTPFQKMVWETLHKVKRGSTITYSELAARVGLPRAVRATATAVANNPISILIPCHRILPKAGGIGKYRWGSDMKQQLLDIEKRNE